MSKNIYVGGRFSKKSKQRKANRTLNVLLGLVILLILVIGAPLAMGFFGNYFFKDNVEVKSVPNNKPITKPETNTNTETNTQTTKPTPNQTTETTTPVPTENTVTETQGEASSNTEKTLVDSKWEPVGTTQSGQHVIQYSQKSVDWKEMTDATSYATNLPKENMRMWYVRNNGNQNEVVITASSLDKAESYYVYLIWMDGQGWKPLKVDKLKTFQISKKK